MSAPSQADLRYWQQDLPLDREFLAQAKAALAREPFFKERP